MGNILYEPEVGDWVDATRRLNDHLSFHYFGQVTRVERQWVDLADGNTVSRQFYLFVQVNDLELLARATGPQKRHVVRK